MEATKSMCSVETQRLTTTPSDIFPIYLLGVVLVSEDFLFTSLVIQNAVPIKSLFDKILPFKVVICPIGMACQQIVPKKFKKRKHSQLIMMYKAFNHHTAIPLPDYIR